MLVIQLMQKYLDSQAAASPLAPPRKSPGPVCAHTCAAPCPFPSTSYADGATPDPRDATLPPPLGTRRPPVWHTATICACRCTVPGAPAAGGRHMCATGSEAHRPTRRPQHTDKPLKISSALCTDFKGYIYVEAFKEAHVREATQGLNNLFYRIVQARARHTLPPRR